MRVNAETMLSIKELGKTQARAKGIMKLQDYKELANNILDFMCEIYGINFVATHLIAVGFTNDNLLELGFEQETIHQANENVEKGE